MFYWLRFKLVFSWHRTISHCCPFWISYRKSHITIEQLKMWTKKNPLEFFSLKIFAAQNLYRIFSNSQVSALQYEWVHIIPLRLLMKPIWMHDVEKDREKRSTVWKRTEAFLRIFPTHWGVFTELLEKYSFQWHNWMVLFCLLTKACYTCNTTKNKKRFEKLCRAIESLQGIKSRVKGGHYRNASIWKTHIWMFYCWDF